MILIRLVYNAHILQSLQVYSGLKSVQKSDTRVGNDVTPEFQCCVPVGYTSQNNMDTSILSNTSR